MARFYRRILTRFYNSAVAVLGTVLDEGVNAETYTFCNDQIQHVTITLLHCSIQVETAVKQVMPYTAAGS